MLEDLECGGRDLGGTPGIREGESRSVRGGGVREYFELRNDAEGRWSATEGLYDYTSKPGLTAVPGEEESLAQKRSELAWLLAVMIEPLAVTTSISTTWSKNNPH